MVVVEPIEEHIRAFKQKVPDTSVLGHVEFQFHCKTFEEFMDERESNERFHLITAIHVMYFADTEIWMRQFNEILEENARILIFLAMSGNF